MRLGAFAFILASLVLASLFASPALAGRRVALVIGNSEYEHISRLENPINDAKDVAETLGKLEFEIILVPNADRDRFEQALVEFGSKASGSDLALVYYAGHGVQHGDTNYLLPTDIAGDQGVVEIKAIDMGKVRRQLDKATGVKILILDACRNDPFTESRGFERASIGSEGAAKGMLIAYAAAPGQVAMDGKGRRNSPFAEVLVDHLKKASGVEIRTLFNHVADEVSVKTSGRQLPNINSMIHGDFYFLSPDEMCERSWKKAVDSQDLSDFKAIVANYPTCRRAFWAQARLDLFDYHRVCDAENKKLDAIGVNDLDSLNNASELMKCEAARTRARRLSGEEHARRDAQIAREKEEAVRREGERLAAENLEAERRRLVREEDERRREAERKKAEDREKLSALQDQQRNDCERENAELARIAASGLPAALEEFRKRAITCPTIGAAIDHAQKQLRDELARICDQERKTFSSLGPVDRSRLRASAEGMSCKEAREYALRKIDELDTICSSERKSVTDVDTTAFDAQKHLRALRAKPLSCAEARNDLDETIAAVERRVRSAQNQLARLGCYSGKATGNLDKKTTFAVFTYSRSKRQPDPARLTDGFVAELVDQNEPLCVPKPKKAEQVIVTPPSSKPPRHRLEPEPRRPRMRVFAGPSSTPKPPSPHREPPPLEPKSPSFGHGVAF
jgi:hypothetical protein